MTATALSDSSVELYEQFARIGKAVAAARRIELLDLLCQGERNVEELAKAAGMTVTNTSQHLRILHAARLVETRKDGTKVIYRLADDRVCRFFLELCELGHARLVEVDQLVRGYVAGEPFQAVSREELIARLERAEVVLVDVRPQKEYAAGHIAGAVSIPLEELPQRLEELPADAELVAYCRGSYCLLASSALQLLRDRGRRASRLADGFPEWRLAGLPVETGAPER